jgi:hypothetical protein
VREWKRVIKNNKGPGEVQADLQDGSIIFIFFPVKQDRQIGWEIQFRDNTRTIGTTYSHPYQAQVPPELFVNTNMVNETIYEYQGTIHYTQDALDLHFAIVYNLYMKQFIPYITYLKNSCPFPNLPDFLVSGILYV